MKKTILILATAAFALGMTSCKKKISEPVASFTYSPTTAFIGQTVTFTDNSTNTPTSWSWDFGDGGVLATAQNVTHFYGSAGTFNVTLSSTNSGGTNTTSKSITVVDATKFVLTNAGFSDAGTEDMTYNSSTGTAYGPLTYNMSIAQGSGLSNLVITGLGNYSCSGGSYTVNATITSATTFTIPSQVDCNYTFSGSGTINSNNKLVITYVATYSDPSHSGQTITDHGVATQQ